MQQTSPISEHVPSESSQDFIKKISSYMKKEKKWEEEEDFYYIEIH